MGNYLYIVQTDLGKKEIDIRHYVRSNEKSLLDKYDYKYTLFEDVMNGLSSSLSFNHKFTMKIVFQTEPSSSTNLGLVDDILCGNKQKLCPSYLKVHLMLLPAYLEEEKSSEERQKQDSPTQTTPLSTPDLIRKQSRMAVSFSSIPLGPINFKGFYECMLEGCKDSVPPVIVLLLLFSFI